MGNTPCCDICLNKQTNEMKLYKLKGNFRCKVVDVYDGDTVTIVLYNKFGYEKHKLRMFGYDSPEMKPRLNIANRDNEIKKAKQAKLYLSNIVLNKIVTFESMGYDKYGRLLGKLFVKQQEINALMVSTGHGYPYYGGTKKVKGTVT
jgi:endonuclease YncB( thermonuclease family)